MSYKRQKLNPSDFTILTGKDKHELELVPGTLDLWVQWYGDRDVMVSILYADGKRIPYMSGLRGSFNVQTPDVLSLLLECTKATTVAVCVSYKDMSIKEKLDPTPLVITPPAPGMLHLQDVVRAEIARITGGDDILEVDDEDNLEEDDEEDGFGPGFMEDEEVAPESPAKKRKGRGASPDSDVRPGNEPEPGNDPELDEAEAKK